MVTNLSMLSSTYKENQNYIKHHQVRGSVAAGVVNMGYTTGEFNLANLLTKPLDLSHHHPLTKEFLVKVNLRLAGGVRELGLISPVRFYNSYPESLE